MEDALYRFLGLYKRSPPWVKRTVGACYGLLPYSVRYGRNFAAYSRLAAKARSWNREEHDAYQYRKLKELLEHAYSHVPYYQEKYRVAGVSPDDFRSLVDLQKFPPITREEIKNRQAEMFADNLPEGERLYTSTSGSSGVPLELYHHKGVTRPKERAFLHDLFGEFGFRKGDRVVVFRGEVIEGGSAWYYDPVDHNLILSSYLLSDTTVAAYCERIWKLRPAAIRGYPFMIFKLVQLMIQHGIEPFRLKCVILESENIYEHHRSVIQGFFGCPVCHYYGHTERLVFGGNCRVSEEYHVHPEYGHIEVVRDDGGPASEGEEGEIVATGFDNLVMPLIRYRTRDYAVRGGDMCACGRNFPMLRKIMGRAEEYVLLANGEHVPFHNLLAGIHGRTWGLAYKLQCVQERRGSLQVNVIPAEGVAGEEAVAVFVAEIGRRVDGNVLAIDGKVVTDIPATRSGKTKLFIQRAGAGD